MNKRSNWEEFKNILEQNHITKLYHFTDRDNLENIIKNGGLYSWKDCEERGISIPKPGGGGPGSPSWSLDQRDKLEHYVHVSFTMQHPMMYVAMNEDRISNPVILEIDPEVIYDENTKYADRNATRTGANVGGGLEDFKKIHFQTVKARNHFDFDVDEQPFYNEHEEKAKEGDGILLNKFYNEGSCATIVAAWMTSEKECRWMSYGDSVVFHYKKGVLEHSFTKLSDFSNPPRLVSCKDPLEEEGFRSGIFTLDETSVVFAASDALSHYILMMYELSKCQEFREELADEYLKQSGNSQLLKTAETIKFDFERDVLFKLVMASESDGSFRKYIEELYGKGLIDMDDFTFTCISLDGNALTFKW